MSAPAGASEYAMISSGNIISRYLPLLALAGAVAMATVSGCQGYRMGYAKAESEGQAVVAQLRQEYAEAMARAERAARERLQAEMARADEVAIDLDVARAAHAADTKTLKARIADATRNSTHTFSGDFVRMYNAAIGAGPRDIYSSGGAAGATGDASAGTAANAGLLAADSGVTEADVLAHITDYGQRCRDVESQLRGWIDLSRGWEADHEP